MDVPSGEKVPEPSQAPPPADNPANAPLIQDPETPIAGQPALDTASVLAELANVREKIAKVDGIREGQHRAVVALSVIIGLAGIATLVQFANSAIDSRVKLVVDDQVARVAGELEQRVDSANSAALSSENSAGRAQAASLAAEAAAASSQSALAMVGVSATQSALVASAGEWIVIFSSNTTPEGAVQDAGKLVAAGYSPAVYKVGDSYVAALGIFPSQEQAQVAELAVAAQFNRSLDLMNLSVTCPYRRFFEQSGFFGCYFEPQATPTP